jgi:MFS superfamily sulfate permease-like transporter
MESQFSGKLFSQARYDLPAGLVVFLVALPLCLGIALASGAPLFSGIIAGIVGGTIVALASDSQLGVSGPAAGLVVIVLAGVEELGTFEIFLLALVFAGVIQLAMGYLRMGVVAYYFPVAVIKGMLAAIGIIIILKQLPHAFGVDSDYEGDLAFWQENGKNTFTALGDLFSALSPGATLVAVVSLGILILWGSPMMQKQGWTQYLPGALVVVILGILANLFLPALLGASWAISPEHLVQLPVAASWAGMADLVTFPDFSAIANPGVYKFAFILALVASLETLLTAEATDKLDPYRRRTPPSRELKAQGVGNLISGLIGGLPITQVIVRSSANIQSGGRTKASAFFHGILLLICVLAIPMVLNLIPLASLAAILIIVGFKLARPSLFKQMQTKGRSQFIPFVSTILAILFTDLLVGIGIGMAVSITFILLNHYKNAFSFRDKQGLDEHEHILNLAEEVSFLNKGQILNALHEMPKGSKIIVDGSRNVHLDQDVMEVFRDFARHAYYSHIDFEVVNLEGWEPPVNDSTPPPPALELEESPIALPFTPKAKNVKLGGALT